MNLKFECECGYEKKFDTETAHNVRYCERCGKLINEAEIITEYDKETKKENQRKGQWLWNQLYDKYYTGSGSSLDEEVGTILWNLTDEEFDEIMGKKENESEIVKRNGKDYLVTKSAVIELDDKVNAIENTIHARLDAQKDWLTNLKNQVVKLDKVIVDKADRVDIEELTDEIDVLKNKVAEIKLNVSDNEKWIREIDNEIVRNKETLYKHIRKDGESNE